MLPYQKFLGNATIIGNAKFLRHHLSVNQEIKPHGGEFCQYL